MTPLQAPRDAIPSVFCWTRYGTEACEAVEQILVRKERERVANEGFFLWGVGNSIGPSLHELLRHCREPDVIFSPMRGHPARVDVHPRAVAEWRSGWDLFGRPYTLPRHSVVTSRYTPRRARHFALVCYSETPLLQPSRAEEFSLRDLRNLATGTEVGASQVTCVVARSLTAANKDGRGGYSVGFRAVLREPYFVRLVDPIVNGGVGSPNMVHRLESPGG